LPSWEARFGAAPSIKPEGKSECRRWSSIVVVVAAALMLLAESNHLVMLFVALETVTVGFYILVSYNRASALTLEAGLK
jgi:NADH:ubiquinone oxidoreductase subunit 2 (subunit N)